MCDATLYDSENQPVAFHEVVSSIDTGDLVSG
jgi:hypothetical protein